MQDRNTRLYMRVTPQEKKRIEQIAVKCGLSQAEYLRKRALDYTPQTVLSDAFYDFSRNLGELLNRELSSEVEAAALKLFDEMQTELLTPGKETISEIKNRLENDAMWQQPDSGL
ncbi:MAG TPA: hypothetical protein DEP23_00425 [Ruminococcaceae bacterium]|nr:hypothetical protein [Oscillospiraceae bacterium]